MDSILSAYKKARADLENFGKKSCLDFVKAYMDLHGVDAFHVYCWTPYFNDGDVCENTNCFPLSEDEENSDFTSSDQLEDCIESMQLPDDHIVYRMVHEDLLLPSVPNGAEGLPWEDLEGTDQSLLFVRADKSAEIKMFSASNDSLCG